MTVNASGITWQWNNSNAKKCIPRLKSYRKFKHKFKDDLQKNYEIICKHKHETKAVIRVKITQWMSEIFFSLRQYDKSIFCSLSHQQQQNFELHFFFTLFGSLSDDEYFEFPYFWSSMAVFSLYCSAIYVPFLNMTISWPLLPFNSHTLITTSDSMPLLDRWRWN